MRNPLNLRKIQPVPVRRLLVWSPTLQYLQLPIPVLFNSDAATFTSSLLRLLDQEISEEADYCETMRGVRSFIGWHQVPEFESSSLSLDGNPFAGTNTQPMGKVLVKLLSDEWLCKKMGKLNIIITEGYPSCSSETSGF